MIPVNNNNLQVVGVPGQDIAGGQVIPGVGMVAPPPVGLCADKVISTSGLLQP